LENNIISVLSGLKDINTTLDPTIYHTRPHDIPPTKLEKLQLDAARIVTGLPIFTKTDKLYSETGWTTLSSRRHKRKFQLFYNRMY
jgi:hypothetical protein